jgi:hypothetical protein
LKKLDKWFDVGYQTTTIRVFTLDGQYAQAHQKR